MSKTGRKVPSVLSLKQHPIVTLGGPYWIKLEPVYDKKYKNLATTKIHIMKSLIYFEDAESEEMPKILKAAWEDIKKYFQNEVKKLVK